MLRAATAASGGTGAPFAPIPFSPSLEDAYLPGAAEIEAAVRGVVSGGLTL